MSKFPACAYAYVRAHIHNRYSPLRSRGLGAVAVPFFFDFPLRVLAVSRSLGEGIAFLGAKDCLATARALELGSAEIGLNSETLSCVVEPERDGQLAMMMVLLHAWTDLNSREVMQCRREDSPS